MNFFDEIYRSTPPWDIGRPQPAVVALEESGEIVGRVLDVGCGTGENAYYLAERGHETWGVDFAPAAIAKAEAKRSDRAGKVNFRVGNALELASLHERFDCLIDCGLFHTFSDTDRPRYAESARSVLRAGGRMFVLCFSELEPTDWGGPRRVRQTEIRTMFRSGWEVRWIREERFATRNPEIAGRAWLTALRRTPRPRRAA
jgi:SAM-dependent methyltransferase